MTTVLRDSPPGPFAGSNRQQIDCVLGPSRTRVELVDQWENEGGRVLAEKPAGGRKDVATGRRAAVDRVPPAARPARIGALAGSSALHACGRCHGPIRPARASMLGRLLSCCMAVEQYHCADPACGWSGIRRNPGLAIRSLPDRG